jgi:hypothetical protein
VIIIFFHEIKQLHIFINPPYRSIHFSGNIGFFSFFHDIPSGKLFCLITWKFMIAMSAQSSFTVFSSIPDQSTKHLADFAPTSIRLGEVLANKCRGNYHWLNLLQVLRFLFFWNFFNLCVQITRVVFPDVERFEIIIPSERN